MNEIYFCVDLKGHGEAVRRFVRAASKAGMRVALLSGDVSWIYPGNRGFAETLEAYLDYQRSAAPDERFYALHFDVEPHQDAKHAVPLEARLYDRLFTVPDPEADETRPFTDFINPDSGKAVTAWCEPAVAELKPLERIQLERLAYFCADSRLSVPGKPVLNRTVTLRYNAPWLNNHPKRRRT